MKISIDLIFFLVPANLFIDRSGFVNSYNDRDN